MDRDEIVRHIRAFNSSLDVQFLESLSKVELESYAKHLQAVRTKTRRADERVPAQTSTR